MKIGKEEVTFGWIRIDSSGCHTYPVSRSQRLREALGKALLI